MRHAAVYEEDDFADSSAELSLGMGTLIGIFFGLALVCGVFFGFGYMMGHRTPGTYVSSDPLYVSPKAAPQPVAPKPSALVAEQPAETSRVVLPTTGQAGAAEMPVPQAQKAPSAPVKVPEPTATSGDEPQKSAVIQKAVPSPAATMPVAAFQPAPISAATGAIMVQIAAVKSRSDAEALATAVRKDGFNPTVRSEPQDKLLHVQIGPFPNREEAKAMRQKLSSAGYDAFIK